jgi:DNA-binding transcriptional LysR family regulator
VVDGGRETRIAPPSSIVVTDATSARELALAGAGIAYASEPSVREDIRAGRLKWLLPTAASQEDGLFLYFPRRASMAAKLRAFIDAVKN